MQHNKPACLFCALSFVTLMHNYSSFFLSRAAVSRRVPQRFPGCVRGPLWAPQHVCWHDRLYLQTGICFKKQTKKGLSGMKLPLLSFNNVFLRSVDNSGATWGISVDAVLGRPYCGRVPRPPNDPQTHDKDERPCLPVWLCLSTTAIRTNHIQFILWTTSSLVLHIPTSCSLKTVLCFLPPDQIMWVGKASVQL